MNLEILVKVLHDAGVGNMGPGENTSLFVHTMGAEVKKGVLLRLPLDGIKRDPNLPGYFRDEFQAIVRDTSQVEGAAKCTLVQKKLEMFRRRFLNDDQSLAMQVNHIFLDKLPIRYPRSEGQGLEWSLNFKASYVIPGL